MPLRGVSRLLTPGDGVEVVDLKDGVVVGQLEPAEAAGRPALLGGTGWSTLHNTHKQHHNLPRAIWVIRSSNVPLGTGHGGKCAWVAVSLTPSAEHPGAAALIRASVALLPSPWSEERQLQKLLAGTYVDGHAGGGV